MIVKNEEEYIGKALDSVKDLVKERIVVDTGSTDKTIEVTKKHGAKIFNFKWTDDFSAARNFSIDQANEAWILVLDADEILAKEDLEVIKKLVKDDSMTGYTLIQRNYTNEKDLPSITLNKKDYSECRNYYGYCENPLVRLFKNDKRIRFVNKIHELVEPSIAKINGKVGRTDIPIHHYGWDKPANKLKNKKELYLHIIERQIAVNPGNPKLYYDGGKICRSLNLFGKAEAYFKKVIKLNPKYMKPFFNLGEIYENKGMIKDAITCYKQSLSLNEDDDNSLVNLGVIYLKMDKLKIAESLLKEALRINKMNVAAYDNLIAVYIKLKDGRKAIETAKKAYEETELERFSSAVKTLSKHIK